MAMRLLEVTAQAGHLDTINAIADSPTVIQNIAIPTGDENIVCVRLLTRAAGRQRLLDDLHRTLRATDNWRISILPVDSTMPGREAQQDEEDEQRNRERTNHTREELYNNASSSAALNSEFLLMTALAAIVAAVGLITDNTAAVIGAMVIAPLLSPNIALALGAALGNTKLLVRGGQSLLTGILVAIAIGFLIARLTGVESISHEISLRIYSGPDSAVVALAAGAAAALALTSGVPMAMVGVMVAVALLPPAVTVGLVLGMGHIRESISATGLLIVNIASVILAAQAVFYYRGVRPKSWLEQRVAGQSSLLSAGIWLSLLAGALFAAVLTKPGL
jgi:uncharacterized hydrophobic protein (TIGR00341 family)